MSMFGGRPFGTTAAAGFDVSKSGGRPTGTTGAAGFNVSKSGVGQQGQLVLLDSCVWG